MYRYGMVAVIRRMDEATLHDVGNLSSLQFCLAYTKEFSCNVFLVYCMPNIKFKRLIYCMELPRSRMGLYPFGC